MFRSNAKSYAEIRTYLDRVPVIETHEHYTGKTGPVDDVLGFVVGNYFLSDLESASWEREKELAAVLEAKGTGEAERLTAFRELYRKTDKTAYARGMQRGLRECWGVDAIDGEEGLSLLREKLASRDQAFYERMMDQYGIRAKIVDIYDIGVFTRIVEGTEPYSKYCRFAFPLPSFHHIHSKTDLTRLEKYLGRKVTCLDDYLESFEIFFGKSVEFGVVCLKDQSAYWRGLNYANPPKADAERIFNTIISNPNGVFGEDEVRPLDDWLFHRFMRLAARYGKPVQIHTGHMAGIRNDIVKTNAAHLTPVLELHQDVRFDLFHGNWPYMDEYLFLGKNYPNVWLNLCWAQSIDPIYCVELMKRAVMTVPHSKVMAFGGDTGAIEWAVGYLSLARDNVACALSELTDSGWIDMAEARAIAADWMFNNPNELFNLGFDRFEPNQ